MKLDNVQLPLWQQITRIIMYNGGAYLVGDGIANSAEYQAGIGAVIAAIAFGSWVWNQYKTSQNTIVVDVTPVTSVK